MHLGLLGVHLFLQLSSDGGSRTFFISAVRKWFLISNEKFFVYVHPCSVLRGPEQKWLRNLLQLGVRSCTGQNLGSAHFTGRGCCAATAVSPGARRRRYSKILTLERNGTQRGVQENVKALSGLLTHLLYSSLYVDQLSLPLPPHESQASSLIASPPLKRPHQLNHNLLVLISDSRREILIKWLWVKGPPQSNLWCPGGRWC